VLSSALVNPGIASLPVLSSSKDKEAWLQEHLEIEFPQDGEILSISLHGTEPQAADLAALVDAVANAYKKEVLGQERQRKLTIRDMVAKSLESLNHEFKRKAEDYLDIAKGLNKSTGSGGDPLDQINTKRLNRIDGELMRLEGEQLKNETAGEKQDATYLAKRLDQLRKQKEELEKTIRANTIRYVELETRQEELKQLQGIANEMSVKLEELDIDMETPPRIRQVQQAVITLGN
jgi:myosin heavy subunit